MPKLNSENFQEMIEKAIYSKNKDNLLLLREAFEKGAVVDNDSGKPTMYHSLNHEETRNNPDFFKVLFENGMKVDNSENGMNSLYQAVSNNPASKEVIEVMIENGASHLALPTEDRIAIHKQCDEIGISSLPTGRVPTTYSWNSEPNIPQEEEYREVLSKPTDPLVKLYVSLKEMQLSRCFGTGYGRGTAVLNKEEWEAEVSKGDEKSWENIQTLVCSELCARTTEGFIERLQDYNIDSEDIDEALKPQLGLLSKPKQKNSVNEKENSVKSWTEQVGDQESRKMARESGIKDSVEESSGR